MFDFAWTEIALIAGVALIAIGPKDMPVAIRAVAGMVKKARRMAAEFQTHVDEMVREANLDEVKNSFNEIRNFDFKDTLESTLDPDGALRSTFDETHAPSEPAAAENTEAAVAEPVAEPIRVLAPAFIPPGLIPPPEPAKAEATESPAFVPPQFAIR